MKNAKKGPVEYVEDGKTYVTSIDYCQPAAKIDDRYYLLCEFPGHERQIYHIDACVTTIVADNDPECVYYPTGESLKLLKKAVRYYDSLVKKAMKWNMLAFTVKDIDFKMYYFQTHNTTYDYLLDYELHGRNVQYSRNCSVSFICEHFEQIIGTEYPDTPEADLFSTDYGDINKNPLYIAAIDAGDETLQMFTRHAFSKTTEKDAAKLLIHFNDRVLPALPEKYNRFYAVDISTIDGELLARSGYSLIEFEPEDPDIVTNKKWQLNPATMESIGFAGIDEDVISFEEYLEMFDTKEMRENFKMNADFGWHNNGKLKGYTEYEASEMVKDLLMSMSDMIYEGWLEKKPWYDGFLVEDIVYQGKTKFAKYIRKGGLKTADECEGYEIRVNW